MTIGTLLVVIIIAVLPPILSSKRQPANSQDSLGKIS